MLDGLDVDCFLNVCGFVCSSMNMAVITVHSFKSGKIGIELMSAPQQVLMGMVTHTCSALPEERRVECSHSEPQWEMNLRSLVSMF